MKLITFEKDFEFNGIKYKKGQKITVYNEVYTEMIEEDPEIIGKKKKIKKVKAKLCKTCE